MTGLDAATTLAQDKLQAEISRLKTENNNLREQFTLRQSKQETLGPPKDDFERGMDHGAHLVIAHILSLAVAAKTNDDLWYLVYAMQDSYVRDRRLRYQDIAAQDAENERLRDALEDLRALYGVIDTGSRHQGGRKHEFKESDEERLQVLAQQHGLHFRRSGMVYRFQDYTAYGLDQAFGYVEGFARATTTARESTDA